MAVFNRIHFQLFIVCVLVLLGLFLTTLNDNPGVLPTAGKLRNIQLHPNTSWLPASSQPQPTPCTCPKNSILLKDYIPTNQYEELLRRRAKELRQHKARTSSVLSSQLFSSPNSPLKYPIQGFIVRPLQPTLIPGLALHAGHKSSYKVSLHVSEGVLTTELPAEGVTIEGNGEKTMIIKSSSLVKLNDLLAKVSYTSSVYHINTGDLASFQFESHGAVFPIAVKELQLPVLYDMGTDIRSHVTIATKTFLRYEQLKTLLSSIRHFYSNIEVIVADDSFEPEHIGGENIRHYIMPPGQGWFAGRNLAVSQVTTKYFLWVDDDFEFTKKTKIEDLVEVMEAVPKLDVLGGTVQGNQFYFTFLYEEGEEPEGGCLHRKSGGKFHSLPNYPQCFLTGGVVNFFLARTDAVQRVGFDPKLQRVAHSEFFMDGLGSLLVATCGHVSVDHQPKKNNVEYNKHRHPPQSDTDFKLQLLYFKNHLKCIQFG